VRMGFSRRPARFDRDFVPGLTLLSEAAVAELGTVADRLALLRTIAESKRDYQADGLLTAVAERIAAGIPGDDPVRPEADSLLREERQRSHARAFAAAYDLVLKFGLRMNYMPQATAASDQTAPAGECMIASTSSGRPTLLWIRRATREEAGRRFCARVGFHLDYGEILRPTLEMLRESSSTFALAVHGPTTCPSFPHRPRYPTASSRPVSRSADCSCAPIRRNPHASKKWPASPCATAQP
jgi:hypothetical protein